MQTKITALIATIGQNPNFIAFNAHWGFAYFAVTVGVPWYVAIIAAAVKEFWFDPRYETDQNIWPDGALDFTGYLTGIVLRMLVR
jgi:hypothetical protein